MRILLLNYEFPPLGGGGGVFSRDLALELARENEVDVITTLFKGLPPVENLKGLNIYRVPVICRNSLCGASLISLLSFPLPCLLKALELCRKKKYDLINTHFAIPTGPAAGVISRKTGLPNVLSVHGSDIYNPVKKTSPHRSTFFGAGVRFAINNSSVVVANSSYIKNATLEFYSPDKDIRVIPPGLGGIEPTPVTRSDLSLENKKFYASAIGRMVKVKGFDFLIRAVAILHEKNIDIELLLIGDGPERSSLEKLARELGVHHKVHFLGWLQGEKKFQYLALSDVYVMPSIREPFGISLLEAMKLGVPVICTDTGGQRDIVKDETNGLLVPPADSQALAGALESISLDPAKRKAISETNKEYVKLFDIGTVARDYYALFKEVVAKR
jgi:L-malate glycosyltransferase